MIHVLKEAESTENGSIRCPSSLDGLVAAQQEVSLAPVHLDPPEPPCHCPTVAFEQ